MDLNNTAFKVSGYGPQELDLILFRQMTHSPTSRAVWLFPCSQVLEVGGRIIATAETRNTRDISQYSPIRHSHRYKFIFFYTA